MDGLENGRGFPTPPPEFCGNPLTKGAPWISKFCQPLLQQEKSPKFLTSTLSNYELETILFIPKNVQVADIHLCWRQ